MLVLIFKNILSNIYCLFSNQKSSMFITDNLENTGKQNKENNDQERRCPCLLCHYFLHLCSHTLLHSTFDIFERLGVCPQVVAGSRNSALREYQSAAGSFDLRPCRMRGGMASPGTFGSSDLPGKMVSGRKEHKEWCVLAWAKVLPPCARSVFTF